MSDRKSSSVSPSSNAPLVEPGHSPRKEVYCFNCDVQDETVSYDAEVGQFFCPECRREWHLIDAAEEHLAEQFEHFMTDFVRKWRDAGLADLAIRDVFVGGGFEWIIEGVIPKAFGKTSEQMLTEQFGPA